MLRDYVIIFIVGFVLGALSISIADDKKIKKIEKERKELKESVEDWKNLYNESKSSTQTANDSILILNARIDSINAIQDSLKYEYEKDSKRNKQKIINVPFWTDTERDKFWSKEFSNSN